MRIKTQHLASTGLTESMSADELEEKEKGEDQEKQEGGRAGGRAAGPVGGPPSHATILQLRQTDRQQPIFSCKIAHNIRTAEKNK